MGDLVAVRISTGRRHQIRGHFAHLGHPVACDGQYGASSLFLSDRIWCGRSFIHRCRLAFYDGAHAPRQALAPLPADLAEALDHLAPRRSDDLREGTLGPAAAAAL